MEKSVSLFLESKPVFVEALKDEMNLSFFFVYDFGRLVAGQLLLGGESDYQVFLNGSLLAYGPARAAEGYERYDEIPLNCEERHNRLLIVLSSYRCASFDRMSKESFLQAVVINASDEVVASADKDFDCYQNPYRLQKVCRFSYQRNFMECYHEPAYPFDIEKKITLPKLVLTPLSPRKWLPRGVSYPTYEESVFDRLEAGRATLNPKKRVYQDRYMSIAALGIFPPSEWQADPNAFVSRLDYASSSYPSNLIDGDFITFAYSRSLTGFLRLRLKVIAPTTLYVIFEEVAPLEKSGVRQLDFKRNTTENIISYDLKEGDYDLLSFEPYTAKYVRVLVGNGKITSPLISLLRYENPNGNRSAFFFEEAAAQSVAVAAKMSFLQNAVDLLTDCPSRERAGWLHDSFFSGQSEFFLTGRHDVEKAFLENYALFEKSAGVPEGMLPMCYPADFAEANYIPTWALWYLLELEQFFKSNSDDVLKQASLAKIPPLLAFFKPYENAEGFLENLQGWVFIEWSKENDPESIQGVNFPANMLYAQALLAASSLLGELALKEKGESLKTKIAQFSFDGHYFNDNAIREASGAYQLSGRHGETTQYYAFYFGIATPESQPALWQEMLTDYGPHRNEKADPSVYPSNVLPGYMLRLSLLSRLGYGKETYQEILSYFAPMADLTGTLWEHNATYASLNHGFTSYVFTLLLAATTGLLAIDEKGKRVLARKITPFTSVDYVLALGDAFLRISASLEGVYFTLPSDYTLEWVQ